MCHREKLSKVASALLLHVHATCVPNVDCQSPTVPMYLDLSMKARSRHTYQAVTLLHEGTEGLGQLGTRPAAKDCAMG